ncbi:unnamed protein product, partial [Allacma fusca]
QVIIQGPGTANYRGSGVLVGYHTSGETFDLSLGPVDPETSATENPEFRQIRICRGYEPPISKRYRGFAREMSSYT